MNFDYGRIVVQSRCGLHVVGVEFFRTFQGQKIGEEDFTKSFMGATLFSILNWICPGSTLKVENFACTNFRDRNFRENLFSRISQI